MKKKVKISSIIVPIIITVLCALAFDYIVCPAYNLKNATFYAFLVFTLIVGGFSFLVSAFLAEPNKATNNSAKIFEKMNKKKDPNVIDIKDPASPAEIAAGIMFIGIGVVIAVLIVMGISSAKLFRARGYSQVLSITEGSIDELPSVEKTGAIALMDTASARKLGDREVGSLSEVVSQYEIYSDDYMQLNIGDRPVKVAPLAYASFFKWINNKANGVPGYVSVDPVSMDADYVKLGKTMTYVPSAYFGEDLFRHIRQSYRTTMFYHPHFEVDEAGNPWYVAPTYTYSVGMFGGEKVTGAILVDPSTGEMNKYELSAVPEWVDIVANGNLICSQYNNYAQLQKGFWNSVIGQNGCRKVTEKQTEEEGVFEADFGYIAKDGDIYIYTGITSVNGDSSNIGFIIANERTGETTFISAPGADEFSAMSAAEGEVQEKRYEASFPSLITINDVPTYIMVLKDKTGLVKMFACVNVEQYNIVATATRQSDCIDKYEKLIAGEISIDEANNDSVSTDASEGDAINLEDYEEKSIVVKKKEMIDINGNTYLYIVDEKSNIYKAKYADVISMILVEEGDKVTIRVNGDKFITAE